MSDARSSRPRHRRTVSPARIAVRRAGVALVAASVLAATAVTVTVLIGSKSHGAAGATSHTPKLPHVTTTTVATGAITMSFVGDTDLGNTPQLPANPWGYLNPVKAALKAQIQFMNLEGTLTNGGSSKCGSSSTNCYAFRNPPVYAQVYRNDGFLVLNSANNHSHDFGSEGVNETTTAIHHSGMVQAGLPGQIAIERVGTIKVAFVDFAPYFNTNNLLNFSTAQHLITLAKQRATLVVVYMHVGAEGSSADHVTGREEYYVGEDRGNAKSFAHFAIDHGANLVVASGPHTLRGMEFYRGRLIAYSLGDFANYYNFANVGTLALSGILRVTISSTGKFVSAKFISLTLQGAGRPFIDNSGAARKFVAQLSLQDFGRNAARFAVSGAVTATPVP